MLRLQTRRFLPAARYFAALCACLAAVFLSSCKTVQPDTTTVLPPRYSIVFVIHGDGDYLYHDRNGNEFQADEKTLDDAVSIAQQNPHAEVFIFHEKPKAHFLLVFPLPDGEFYYYRNGNLLAKESYWRDNGDFQSEAGLYHAWRGEAAGDIVSLFLYFGHEIPEFDGKGYDASYPNRKFTIHDLAAALGHMRRDSTMFDGLVLSTCFNGTPYSVAALTPYARFIIGSPDNLHLSYFDIASLNMLIPGLTKDGMENFSKSFAQHAFDRLTNDIQTAITVAVYDVRRVQGFLTSIKKSYDETLESFKNDPNILPEHCDCADDSIYAFPNMSEGVHILYRPARFGRLKSKQHHSGWECWKRGNYLLPEAP